MIPAQLEMLAALIADIGYEPITTSSPAEALKTCAVRTLPPGPGRRAYMPGMDGYAFFWIRPLRARPWDPHHYYDPPNTRWSRLWRPSAAAQRIFFCPKPIDRVRLKRTLDDVAALYDQRRRVRELEEQLLKDLEFPRHCGQKPGDAGSF